MSARRLAALVVNHRSGAWTLRCVESLQLEWERLGRAPEDLQIVVADSGSGEAEETWFRSLERLGVTVKRSPANLGYAAGLNLAYAQTSGAPGDAVALLNPDLYFLPGSLAPLLEGLDDPRVGAVGPRVYLDEERQIQLPPNELPTPRAALLEALASRLPGVARRRAARLSQRAFTWWTTREPQSTNMLSGACLVLRREVVESLGGPMDGRYPLYFEDADLCARLARRGFALELRPAAEVLHHWSRCAGPSFEGEVARRHEHGRRLFLATHYFGPLCHLLRGLRGLFAWVTKGQPARALHAFEDLGGRNASPEFPALGADLDGGEGSRGPLVLELSLTPYFGLVAGVLLSGADDYRFPARTWAWLFPGTYFARVVDPSGGELLGAWRFDKQSAARSWPLDPTGMELIEERRSAERAASRSGERVG